MLLRFTLKMAMLIAILIIGLLLRFYLLKAGLSLSKKTSKAIREWMVRLGLEPTGNHEADIKTLKKSGKVPRWNK